MLSTLLLVSSSSYAVDLHYCQGHLSGLSLFGETSSCHDGPEAEKKGCSSHKSDIAASDTDPCCNNLPVVIEDSEIDNISPQIVTAEDVVFMLPSVVFIYSFLLGESLDIVINDDPVYMTDPPIISRDIPVLYESFLI